MSLARAQEAAGNVEGRTKLAWGLTLAGAALACLLVLGLALNFFAMERSIYIALLIGVTLSIVGMRFTRNVASRRWRYIGYWANGGILTFYLLSIFCLTLLFIDTTEERILILDGYIGDVYIAYGVQDGETVSSTRWAVTYRIPKDGVLRVRGPCYMSGRQMNTTT